METFLRNEKDIEQKLIMVSDNKE